MIPKIIWQTHNYVYEDLPLYMKKITSNWKNINPGWDYRYIDHIQREEFIKNKHTDFYNVYKTLAPIPQGDTWRMLTMYEYGGVYADMDSICIKPLDYMLEKYNNEEVITVPRESDGTVNNALFAAVKGSEIFSNIVKSIKNEPIKEAHWHSWRMFNKHVQGPGIGMFDAGIHAEEFKTNFYEFDIDYYGETVTYKHYLKNILKVSDEEYFASIAS